MFRFTIRELVLLTLVVAMGVGWWLDHRRQRADYWDLRAAIETARFSTYVQNGQYYIEPMTVRQHYWSQQKRQSRKVSNEVQ